MHAILNANTDTTSTAIYPLLQVFMWIGVLLTFITLLPEIIQVIKTKNTTSISLWMYVLYPLCGLAWIAYAILLYFEDANIEIWDVIGLALSEVIATIFSLIVLVYKMINVYKAKNAHMTEAEWYRSYQKHQQEKAILKKKGIVSPSDEIDNTKHQESLSAILDQLSQSHPAIVDKRVTESSIYRKTAMKNISSPLKRLEHFKNVATNAELSKVISLVYLDLYYVR